MRDYSLRLSNVDKPLCLFLCLKLQSFHFVGSMCFRRLKGKELEGMSFSDLVSLENTLNDSLHSVKDRKVKKTKNHFFFNLEVETVV